MEPHVVTILEGPVGSLIRIAALVTLAGVGIWVLTGIRIFGDEDGPRRGLFLRLLLGAVAAAILIPLINDPVSTVETVQKWSADLVGDMFT